MNTAVELFHTRAKANEGIELKLSLPDGTPTEHWIRVRGIDSDGFKAAETESRRNLLNIATEKNILKLDTTALAHEEELRISVSLVISWSFPMECTPDNVRNFLKEAPQIAEQINRIAARRAAFFVKPSADSLGTPPSSSA